MYSSQFSYHLLYVCAASTRASYRLRSLAVVVTPTIVPEVLHLEVRSLEAGAEGCSQIGPPPPVESKWR